MTQAAAGPHVAACLLLLLAGAAKIRRPTTARRALVTAGLPVPVWLVSLGGMAELGLGTAALVLPGSVPALAVACLFAGFAAFSGILLKRDSGAGCGCFGESPAPIGTLHVLVNLSAVFAALSVAGDGGLTGSAGAGLVPLVALGAVLAWMAYLVMVPLPRLMQAVREARP